MCGAGNLTHTVLPAYLLVTPFFSLSSDGHWMVIYATTAVVMLPLGITANRYSHITLLQENIHGFRDFMLLAIGTLYMFSYRTVGMEIDGNCCPYCLPQLQHHAPGVLVVVSLALRSLLRADLQIL